MDYKTFSPLYMTKLAIAALYSLIKSTIELAKPVVAELGPIPTVALSQLEAAQEDLGASINKAQKSALTPEIKILDAARDKDVIEIFRIVRTYVASTDESKRSAASSLQLFLTPYKGVARQPINIETASLSDMIAKYKAPGTPLIAAATTLGIDGLFTDMEAKNNELNDIYQSRNAEYAGREIPATEVKPAAINSYMQFCTAIEQACNYTPDDTLTALFNKMDEYRKTYHALKGQKEAKTKNDSTEK